MIKSLFTDSLAYGVINAVQKLSPFFIIPIVIHHLGPNALKIYDVAFAYVSVFLWVIVMGQDVVASMLLFDEKKTSFNKRQLTSYAFYLQLVTLFFCLGLLLPFSGMWGRLLFSDDAPLAAWWRNALGILPAQIVLNYALNILLWQRRKKAYATLCLVQTVTSVASVYVSIVFLHGGISALFYCIIGSASLTAVAGFMLVGKQLTAPLFPLNMALLKTLPRLGLPIALTAFFGQLLPAIDRFFLLHYHYGNALAPYVLASKLGSLVGFVTTAFTLAFTPYSLAKLNDENAEEELSNLFRVVSASAFLLVPVGLLFKDLLVRFFADASYSVAAQLLPFFFFGWVFDLFIYFTFLGIYRSQKTHLSLLLYAIGFVIVSVLNFLLIPFYGLFGAAISFCAGKALLFVICRASLKKYFRLRIHAVSFWAAFLVAVICSCLVYLLPIGFAMLVLAALPGLGVVYFGKDRITAFFSGRIAPHK